MLTPSGAVVNPSCCSNWQDSNRLFPTGFCHGEYSRGIKNWVAGSEMGFVSGVSWRKMGQTQNYRGDSNTQMPTYRFQTSIPAPLEQVYEHITGFTDGGPANLKALAEKHGELLEQDEEVYVFKGASEDDLAATQNHTTSRQHKSHEIRATKVTRTHSSKIHTESRSQS